jgi:hypothetical protein
VSDQRTITLAPHLQSAKVAFGDLVDAFGGQVAVAAETGRSQSRISDYAHRNRADFPPLDVIDALEARTVGVAGHPHVTAWLAKRRGYELVKLPDPSAPAMPLTALLSELAKASGQLSAGILSDISSDNDISAPDAWRRLKDAGELVRVAVELEARLKARASEGTGG